jgi:chemotaxis protein MotA
MDKSTAIGLVVAAGGILGGLTLDGGNISQILQPTAAMIVGGGTLGAVMLQFPLELVKESAAQAKQVLFPKASNTQALIERIVGYANKARKQGVVALDKDLDSMPEPFLRKAVMLAVDGVQPAELRTTMECELYSRHEHDEHIVQLYEAAGGYAPTIGILGAIMGLIQVMQHLDQINEVGRGIAVAFVATIYGVALANLVLLPMAGKLKLRNRELGLQREVMLEGVAGILEGINPRMLQTKLLGYVGDPAEGKKAAEKAGAGQPAAAAAEAAQS